METKTARSETAKSAASCRTVESHVAKVPLMLFANMLGMFSCLFVSFVFFYQIRRQMIDGRPGDMQIRTLLKSIDEVSGFSSGSV